MNYVGLAIISPTVWHLLEDLRMCHTEARVTFATDKEASKIMGTLWGRRPSACSQALQVLSIVACVVVCHSSGRFFHTNSMDLTR